MDREAKMFKRLIQFAVLIVLTLCVVVPAARAAAIIDFGTGSGTPAGTFILNGSNAKGLSITIGTVSIFGAPSSNGTYAVTNGFLNFDTAANTISITGSIAGLGIAQGTLLSGSFTSFTANIKGLAVGAGTDTKSAALLTAIGLPTDTLFGLYGFSIAGNPVPGGPPGVYAVTSTDMENTAAPEPSSLVLLGSGLIGFCAFYRRKNRT